LPVELQLFRKIKKPNLSLTLLLRREDLHKVIFEFGLRSKVINRNHFQAPFLAPHLFTFRW